MQDSGQTMFVIKIGEVYTECVRTTLRASLWEQDDSRGLPTVGEILAEMSKGDEGGAAYDAEWPERAARTLW